MNENMHESGTAGNDTEHILELKDWAIDALGRGALAEAIRNLALAVETMARPRRLAVVDGRELERIVLTAERDGEPAIRLYDADGHERATLALERLDYQDETEGSITEHASRLTLTGSDNGGQAELVALSSGFTSLAVSEILPGSGDRGSGALIEVGNDNADLGIWSRSNAWRVSVRNCEVRAG